MKKALMLIGIIIAFSVLKGLLTVALGIEFPSMEVAIAYDLVLMATGAAIVVAIDKTDI